MSQLSPFVRAFRALADGFESMSDDAKETSNKLGAPASAKVEAVNALLLYRIGLACRMASTQLEQQIAQDLSRTGKLEEVAR